MSDTPRVDALDFGDQSIFPGPGYGRLWELARQLERELHIERAAIMQAMQDHYWDSLEPQRDLVMKHIDGVLRLFDKDWGPKGSAPSADAQDAGAVTAQADPHLKPADWHEKPPKEVRCLRDALLDAGRLRRELPRIVQVRASDWDKVILADEVLHLVRRLEILERAYELTPRESDDEPFSSLR